MEPGRAPGGAALPGEMSDGFAPLDRQCEVAGVSRRDAAGEHKPLLITQASKYRWEGPYIQSRADDPRQACRSLRPAGVGRFSIPRGPATQPGAGRENQALVNAAKPRPSRRLRSRLSPLLRRLPHRHAVAGRGAR